MFSLFERASSKLKLLKEQTKDAEKNVEDGERRMICLIWPDSACEQVET